MHKEIAVNVFGLRWVQGLGWGLNLPFWLTFLSLIDEGLWYPSTLVVRSNERFSQILDIDVIYKVEIWLGDDIDLYCHRLRPRYVKHGS
jgi:hypothetical protein